jgi:hypothetical protein
MQLPSRHTFKLAFIAAVLAGCGGGGGDPVSSANPPPGGNNGGNNGGDNGGGSDTVVLTAACTGPSAYLCSGRDILRVDRGVALTQNAVQVYGLSTSDLLGPDANPNRTIATGLMLPDCDSPTNCGVAEIRKQGTENGRVVLLLDRLGLSWDRRTERPLTIDTFSTQMGRATMDGDNVVRFDTNLPHPSNLDFYDWAVKGANGTQAHYANNVYFPRDEPPVRCPEDDNGQPTDCPTTESEGVKHNRAIDNRDTAATAWQNGGFTPDMTSAGRLHGEGDLRAGDNTPDPVTGERRWIVDSSEENQGFGPAYPGFKGYRTLNIRSYQYANLGTWLTSDTVNIVEWVTDNQPSYEHAKFRRGMVAFGNATPAGAVPSSGTITYRGIVYGQYVPNSTEEISEFTGDASITVNYATGDATINLSNTRTHENGLPVPLPISFTSDATLDPVNAGLRNYASGAANAESMQGGVGARLFGPQANEVGGTFSMEDGSGQTAIGGFIALRQ